jgi:hypothetical protein
MAVKKFARGLIITGIVGIVFSLAFAILRTAGTGTLSIQILGIEISIILVLLGAGLLRLEINESIQPGKQIRALIDQILNLPIVTWVLIGFLIIYFLLFLFPIFLSSNLQMNYIAGYIPNLNPIGNDLTVMIDLIKGWVTGTQSPYAIQFYPPLTYIIFAPLLLINNPLMLYRLFTLFTFLSYCILTLLLPLKIIDRKYSSLALLLFVTGLFSYGFQFELERGQYNVFTFVLCLASIYIFHDHPKYRLLAYLLFSLSVQLKLYPAIFILMFVDDWRDWKNVLRRFLGMGLFNLLLFFVMGYQTFWDFIRSVTAQVVNPSWIGVWNHSISSFVSIAKQDGFGLIGMETLRAFRHNSTWVEAFLLLMFLVLFLAALIIFHLRKEAGLDPYLLLSCTIGALILPISYDYTLSILTAPMLLFLCAIEINATKQRFLSILLILAISAAYFTTLIPYNYRPYSLNNSLPLLFLILILATIMNFLRYRNERGQAVKN